jgi:hypothetical protein
LTTTPAPWINVIANPAFGFQVSESGAGYAWSINSQQNPITPWPNDPVSDSPHDALYLRDEDSGDIGDDFFPDWWAVDLKGFERPRWFIAAPLDISIRYLLAEIAGTPI